MSNNIVLKCVDLKKSYNQGDSQLDILNGINLEVEKGQTVSITGSSGSGKSTLLHLLAGLDNVSSGRVILDGDELTNLSDNKVCQIRNTKLGFIYQFHHLLPEFTALENVLMPIKIQGKVNAEKTEFAHHLLSRLGLTNRAKHFPGQLSGGERQRVAIARAVINNPKLVFADEPTGNLDNTTSNQVLEIFFNLQQELNTSLVIVTHDPDVARKTFQHYHLKSGYLNKQN